MRFLKLNALCAGVSVICVLAGCAAIVNEPDEIIEEDSMEEQRIMLGEYYERTAGTEEEQPYDELVLFTLDEESLLLEHYENGGTSEEYVTGYRVSKAVYDAFMDVVETYGMPEWNDRTDLTALEGKRVVVKFYKDGSHTRVSSDQMPEDTGPEAFDAVRSVLSSGIDDSALVYEYKVSEGKKQDEEPEAQ